jgi:hypothetical protein
MVTNASDGDVTITTGWDLRGLHDDQKPTDCPNGSTFLEMDTGKVFAFDKENTQWREL